MKTAALIATIATLAAAPAAGAHPPTYPTPAHGERYAYSRGQHFCAGGRVHLIQLAVWLSTTPAATRLLAHPQRQPIPQLRARVATIWAARQIPKRLAPWYRHGCVDAPR